MTVVAHSILADNTVADAQRVVAAEVFWLAMRGYITLEFLESTGDDGEPTADSVRVTRTSKPADGMQLEERLLLNALSPQVVLSTHQQVPVAQTIAVLTCHLLRHGGLARNLTPQQRVRRINICWYIFVAIIGIGAAIVGASIPKADLVCAAPLLVIVMITGWNKSMTPYRMRAILYTKQGKNKRKLFQNLRKEVCDKKVHQADRLPYELLWTSHDPLQLPSEKPDWLLGAWPATPAERTALLRTMFDIVAAALNQPRDKKGRFALNDQLMDEAALFMLIGDIETVVRTSADLIASSIDTSGAGADTDASTE